MKYLSITLKAVLVLLTLLISNWSGRQIASDQPIGNYSDGCAYIRMAYHIYHNGTFSFDKQDSDLPRPSAYREPGYSALLACFFEDNMMKATELEDPSQNRYMLYKLRQGQMILLPLAGLVGLFVVYKLTGSFWLGYIAMLLLGFSMELINNINSMYAEQLCVPIVLLMSYMLYLSLRDKKLIYFAIAGLLMGILVLVKAIFMYLLVFILPLTFIALKGLKREKIIIAMAVLTACYFIPVGSWMVRNKVQLGKFFITGRAGNVMALRVEYNKMNFTEWCGSFLYWTPDSYAIRLMHQIYGNDCLVENKGKLANLNRSNKSGYYSVGKTYGSSDPEKDSKNQKSYAMEFLKHPIKHILVTLPTGWRSIMFADGALMVAPFTFMVRSSVLFSLAYFIALIIVVYRAIRARAWEMLVFTLPACYLIMMNSLFTHGLTRYTLPNIGIQIVCLLLIINQRRRKLLQ